MCTARLVSHIASPSQSILKHSSCFRRYFKQVKDVRAAQHSIAPSPISLAMLTRAARLGVCVTVRTDVDNHTPSRTNGHLRSASSLIPLPVARFQLYSKGLRHVDTTAIPIRHERLPPRMEELRCEPSVSSSPNNLSPFEMLSLLPSPLLALVASHLDCCSLLVVQRCSSAFHRLCSGNAYIAVAWRWAELHPSTEPRLLHRWALAYKQCIADVERCSIPASVWHTALPASRAVLAKADERDERYQQLRKLVTGPQRTERIWAQRVERWCRCVWEIVESEQLDLPADVERVEMLADIDLSRLREEALPRLRIAEVRCRLVLQAYPYLQRLSLEVDTEDYEDLIHPNTFALLPRLRSLHLTRRNIHAPSERISAYPCMTVGLGAALSRLSHLTSLSLTCIPVFENDLLAIASHSTLEELRIDGGEHMMPSIMMKHHMRFPISVEEDDKQLKLSGQRSELDGDIDREKVTLKAVNVILDLLMLEDDQLSRCYWSEGMQQLAEVHRFRRLLTALTRTQPTRRSCEVRLALADCLHRRVRRSHLYHRDDRSAFSTFSQSLQHRYRMQVALLRLTLQHQLSEL